MAGSFSASVRGWTQKAKRNARLVVLDATQATAETMTERQASVKETGGAFEVGKVPVDTGVLIGSVIVEVGGSQTGQGTTGAAPDFSAAIVGAELGEPITIGFTAEYARPVEYGTGNMAGRFFVRGAVQEWESTVARSARKFDARTREGRGY